MERREGLTEPYVFRNQNEISQEEARWERIMDSARQTDEYKALLESLDEIRKRDEDATIFEHRNRGEISTIIAIRFDRRETDLTRFGPKVRRTATRFASKGVGLEFDERGFVGVRHTTHLSKWSDVDSRKDVKGRIKEGMKKARHAKDLRFGRGEGSLREEKTNTMTFRWHEPSFGN